MDSWGTVEKSCPRCGGDLEWFRFGMDCRGNPPSAGIDCKQCKYSESDIPSWFTEALKKQEKTRK